MPVCNKDCFNCIHPDCINEDVDYSDYKQSKKIDKMAEISENLTSDEKRKERYKRYYAKNKEKLKAKYAKYRSENREKVRESRRKWDTANKEYRIACQKKRYAENINGCRDKQLAWAKEYYQKNREKINNYNKEYYQKHKEERNAYKRAYRKRKKEEMNARMDKCE